MTYLDNDAITGFDLYVFATGEANCETKIEQNLEHLNRSASASQNGEYTFKGYIIIRNYATNQNQFLELMSSKCPVVFSNNLRFAIC